MEQSTGSQTNITEGQLEEPFDLAAFFQAFKMTPKLMTIDFKYAKEHTSVCWLPQPSKLPYNEEEDIYVALSFSSLVELLDGINSEEFQRQIQEVKKAIDELEDMKKECEALRVMPPRKCDHCEQWCRSDPFEYFEKHYDDIVNKAKEDGFKASIDTRLENITRQIGSL